MSDLRNELYVKPYRMHSVYGTEQEDHSIYFIKLCFYILK